MSVPRRLTGSPATGKCRSGAPRFRGHVAGARQLKRRGRNALARQTRDVRCVDASMRRCERVPQWLLRAPDCWAGQAPVRRLPLRRVDTVVPCTQPDPQARRTRALAQPTTDSGCRSPSASSAAVPARTTPTFHRAPHVDVSAENVSAASHVAVPLDAVGTENGRRRASHDHELVSSWPMPDRGPRSQEVIRPRGSTSPAWRRSFVETQRKPPVAGVSWRRGSGRGPARAPGPSGRRSPPTSCSSGRRPARSLACRPHRRPPAS